MKKSLLPLAVLACCYLLFFAYLSLSYGSLPPRVASHFGLDGRPNGWMSREKSVEFMLGLGILLPAFMVVMMACVGWVPVSFVNLPHRDYWLAPERRRETSAVMFRLALWLGSLSVLFLTGIHWMVVKANTVYGGKHLPAVTTFLILSGYAAGTLIWCVVLKRRFARKSDS